jgi:hypothetical protein
MTRGVISEKKKTGSFCLRAWFIRRFYCTAFRCDRIKSYLACLSVNRKGCAASVSICAGNVSLGCVWSQARSDIEKGRSDVWLCARVMPLRRTPGWREVATGMYEVYYAVHIWRRGGRANTCSSAVQCTSEVREAQLEACRESGDALSLTG